MLAQTRSCRVCRAPLASVFDLGTPSLSGFPYAGETLPRAPLDLCRCPACGLVQLRHTVPPDAMESAGLMRPWAELAWGAALRAAAHKTNKKNTRRVPTAASAAAKPKTLTGKTTKSKKTLSR